MADDNGGRTFRSSSRYQVAISPAGAAAAFNNTSNLKGWQGQAIGRVGNAGLGDGSFGFGTRSNDRVYANVTMSQARRLHKMGALADGAGGGSFASSGVHPRQARHMAGAIELVVDLTEMRKLAKGFMGIATGIERGHIVISRSINDGLRSLRTHVKRDLRAWTGLKVVGKIEKSISLAWSRPSFLTGVLNVKSGHTAVTEAYYGAAWSRANPGATHSAWNRRQIAVHSFMIPGKKPVFKRTGSARLPIAPLWGPNLAREVDRHKGEVQAKVTVAGRIVSQTAARLMQMEIKKAGG